MPLRNFGSVVGHQTSQLLQLATVRCLRRARFTRATYGNVKAMVEAAGVVGQQGTTQLGWDANGNLSLVTTPRGHSHQLLANAINGIARYTPPILADVPTPQTTYGVTEDRAAGPEARPDGVSITRTYETSPNTGRLDLLTFAGGTSPAGQLDYDYYPSAGTSAGHLKTLKGPYGSTRLDFEYDGSLPTRVSWSGDMTASFSRSYDSGLRTASETTVPGSATFFDYDNDNLLTCVRRTQAAACNPSATPPDLRLGRSMEHGQVTKIEVGSVTEEILYSDSAPDGGGTTDSDGVNGRFGELRLQRIKHGNTVIAELTYDSTLAPRDTSGRISRKDETFRDLVTGALGSTRSYGYFYDERNRLEDVEVDFGSALDEAFTYDENGNRASYVGPAGSISVAETLYDAQDRLKKYGTTTFEYGSNGELRTKTVGTEVTTYTYDALGNLTKVVRTGGSKPIVVEYVVDGLGRRIARKVGSDVKRWIYRNGLNPIAELNATGGLVARFVYGSRPNVPDLVIRDGKTYRIIADQLGSPRMIVDVASLTTCAATTACASVPYRADYSSFGEATWKGTGPDNLGWIPFGFAGGIYDPDTGLVRFGARDYDPQIGRWVSKDPIRFEGGLTNIFVYASSDPINRQDSRGTTDQEAGNFLQCVGALLVCRYSACAVPSMMTAPACVLCLGSAALGPCGKPFGWSDPPKGPPEPSCPPGYHRGGWGDPVCVEDDCVGANCPNSCEPSITGDEANQSFLRP